MSEVRILLQVLISRSLVRVQEEAQNSTVVQFGLEHPLLEAWGGSRVRVPPVLQTFVNVRIDDCRIMESRYAYKS